MLFELQAAVGARAIHQRGGGPARGTRQLLAREVQGDRLEPLAFECIAPLAPEQVAESGQVGLLDQEVRLGPSTVAGAARRTAHRGRDPRGQTPLAQRLDLRDRARHRGNHGLAFELCFGDREREGHPGSIAQADADPARYDPAWSLEGFVKSKSTVFLVLACAIGLLAIYISNGVHLDANGADTLIFLAAYALPAVMMGLALWKPPVMAWHGALSLAGFGIVAVRGRVWNVIPHIAELDLKGKASLAMLLVGLIASTVVMTKSPSKRA